MKLVDFLTLESPEEYDLKYELETWYKVSKARCRYSNEKKELIEAVIQEIRNSAEGDHLYRFLLYRAIDIPFDCDSSNGSCMLTNEIYRVLWDWDEDRFTGFGGDTMNSFWMIFSKAIQEYYPDVHKKYKFKESKWLDIGKIIKTPINERVLQEYQVFYKMIESGEKFKQLNLFAKLTHTIGNLCLVPNGFNIFRGRSLFDRWDCSLLYLKNEFGRICFSGYINTFYLTNYVLHGNIISLSESEGANLVLLEKINEGLPDKNLKRLINNVNDNILTRGKRMADELRNRWNFND